MANTKKKKTPAAAKTVSAPAVQIIQVKSAPRPLSPHLTIYKPQITSVLSITHRATGAFLVLGTVMLSIWLIALAYGPKPYEVVAGFLQSTLGLFILLGWLTAFYYHLLNGIRHLFWDMGYGFDLKVMEATGVLVLLGTGLLTCITWFVAIL